MKRRHSQVLHPVLKATTAFVVMLAFLVNNMVFRPSLESALCRSEFSKAHLFCICGAGNYFGATSSDGKPVANFHTPKASYHPENRFTEFFSQQRPVLVSDRSIELIPDHLSLDHNFAYLLQQRDIQFPRQSYLLSLFNKAPPLS